MNRKSWFYGTLVILLTLSVTYLALTPDGDSWAEFKGKDSSQCRAYEKSTPQSASHPEGPCYEGFALVCGDISNYGTPGRCGEKEPPETTGKIGNHMLSTNDYVVKSTLACNWSFFHCHAGSISDENGPLNRCFLSSC